MGVITEENKSLIPIASKDEKYGVGITNYADTVVFGGDKKLAAVRFGGYPETVLSMSDTLFSGSKIALKLPGETGVTELTSFGGKYERRIKAANTSAECVMKLTDSIKTDKESLQNIYIFCKCEEELFCELDSKLSVPLMPDWEEYFIRELRQVRIIRARFLRADFSHCCVKILVNPLGLTAFCALHCKKSATQKIFDLKRAYFCMDFYAKDAVRLSPYKDDK